jgi:hypothetical protein
MMHTRQLVSGEGALEGRYQFEFFVKSTTGTDQAGRTKIG